MKPHMKKHLLICTILFLSLVGSSSFAQETKASTSLSNQQNQNKEITSLKPADGFGAQFTTQADLDQTVPLKIAKIKEMIASGQYGEDRIKVLREELWRFENAVVIKK